MGELYDSVEAVVKGRLQGQGALATLVLCESLLSFLPTDSSRENNYRLLKEYEVMPLGTLEQNRRIDLRPCASVRHGVLYVSHPSAEKVWIPLDSLPSMTCICACHGHSDARKILFHVYIHQVW